MIERFTRALFDAMMSGTGDESEFEAMGPHLELIARACLEALREPTPEMASAGMKTLSLIPEDAGWNGLCIGAQQVWQSMIDVALLEGGRSE